jgi:hypothetical protein
MPRLLFILVGSSKVLKQTLQLRIVAFSGRGVSQSLPRLLNELKSLHTRLSSSLRHYQRLLTSIFANGLPRNVRVAPQFETIQKCRQKISLQGEIGGTVIQ